MAIYDQGGGCACGLYKTCECSDKVKQLADQEPIKPVNPSKYTGAYGFTLIDQTHNNTVVTSSDYRTELYEMYNLIMPFLRCLSAEPDKKYLSWPDRTKYIQSMIDEVNKILNIK